MTTPDARVLRPDAATWRAFVSRPDRAVLSLAGGLLVSTVGGLSGRGDVVGLGVLLLAAVLGALGHVAVTLRTSSIDLRPGQVTYRRWGRTTTLPVGDTVGVLAPYSQPLVSRTLALLVLRRRDGGPRIRLNGGFWSQEALVAIAAHAGAEVGTEPLTARELEERAPGTMPFRDRHPWLFGVAGALVITGLVTVGVLAWFEHRGLPPFDDPPPRRVAVATTADQDRLVGQLVAATGGPWSAPRARLLGCEDDEQYDGWMRWVDVSRDGPGPGAVADQAAAAAAALTAAGLDVGDPEPDPDGSAYLDAVALDVTGGLADAVVEVYLQPDHASLGVHGRCEMPPHG
ncbi:hypothetical protein G5V58_05490 [Nocardioides anomalus]|uniref:PH domain-containing protein n=1 Tax=Nocardioides anomalus TaxID=2712223 RepID=A0A6G6WAN0_9ACTN|nr:hypothetical protein [Nocardioides anomalus]QIG42292.1 hypothetical protein G5V58_05490 [Nocardioides anomalus]